MPGTLAIESPTAPAPITRTVGPVDIFLTPEFETKGHIVRVGLNFKLGRRSRQAVPLK